MNQKTKMKVIIDVAMTALFLLLMNLALTGVLWHEVIGIGILGLFTAHLAVNRQWIKSVASRFTDKIGFRAKAMFVLNAVLLGTMGMTIVSGILISEYLFPALAAQFTGSLAVLVSMHAIFSWLTLAVLVAHTLVHWRWIANLLQRMVPANGLKVIGARVSLVLIAVATIYSFISSSALDTVLPGNISIQAAAASSAAASGSAVSSSGSTNAVQGTSGLITAPDDATASSDEPVVSSSTTATAPTVTLQEFLSKLTCTACGKHCPLSAPQCAKGKVQVQAATVQYNASLSTEITFTL